MVEHKWGLFLELIRWVEGGSCRHDAILRYFGDEAETLAGCGRCDVCRALEDEGEAGDPERVTLIVRKALSGVARVHGRFGLQTAVKLIQGEADERLERAGPHARADLRQPEGALRRPGCWRCCDAASRRGG